MARLDIALPESFLFETVIDVRISDINYGGHMGNDAVLRLAHEARLRFFQSLGYTELNVEGLGIIIADAAIKYGAEAFHGDKLVFQLGVMDRNPYGFDLTYLAKHADTGKEITRLKTGIVFFDYALRRPAHMPDNFTKHINA